ncbi:hypothetical protein WPG_1185 [Winogradskyella sp. PG-2]|nr:hypothetical protein WPG_1185 [Winogradskyella sp. PG-2]
MTCQSNDDNSTDGQFRGIVDWSQTIGGTDEDFGLSIIETTSGNIGILGHTKSSDGDIIDKSLPGNDYWFTTLDINGNIILNKTYGGSGDDRGQALVQTNDGGFAMAGYSMSSDGDVSNNEGFHDNWLIKTDIQGNLIWEKSFGFSGHDHAYALTQTNDNGFFMAGFLDVTASGGLGNTNKNLNTTAKHGIGEFWCHKLDSQGNIQWQRFFGGSANDRAFDVLQTNDGGYLLTGYSESGDFDITDSKGSYDYWVLKLNSSGDLLWQKSFGGSGIDQARKLIKTDDNSYIIVGNSFSDDIDIASNYGGSDYWIIKIDDLGDIIWKKNYGGSNFDYATSIKKSKDGFVLCGYSKSNDTHLNVNYGDNDFWVIKINEDGDLLWQKNFGGSGLDLAYDLIETLDGHIYVIGDTESSDYDIEENKGSKDLLVVKIK